MGMAFMGFTHCENCGKSLEMTEYFICNECKEKKIRKKESNNMNKEKLENYYEQIMQSKKERDILIKETQQMDKNIELNILKYRIRSVERVLNYMNNKCWKKENISELHNKIVHCLNKLNGNIDGIEYNLED